MNRWLRALPLALLAGGTIVHVVTNDDDPLPYAERRTMVIAVLASNYHYDGKSGTAAICANWQHLLDTFHGDSQAAAGAARTMLAGYTPSAFLAPPLPDDTVDLLRSWVLETC